MNYKPSRRPKDPEWQRLGEMPEHARTSPHRPYWVCARFLCAMHTIATCSRLLKLQRKKEAGVWCNEVISLGVRVAEKRGPRHLEVFNLAYEYSEFQKPFEAGLLTGLRDELVIEERDRWDMLTEREQNILEEIAAAGEAGLQSGKLAKKLSYFEGFREGRPTAVGKRLLSNLCERGLLVTEGKGGHLRYKLHHKPAGWPQ